MTISVPPEGNNAKVLNSYFAPLKVEAQVAVNMTVKIAPGSFWTAAGEHVEYVGGNTPVITAPAGDAKWVAITLTSLGVINVIDGASSTNPALPTIPVNELILAGIFIGSGAAHITSDMVFDLRPMWQTHSDISTDLSPYYTMTQTDNLLDNKADTTGTPEVAFILNADQTGVTSTDVMLTAERGDEPNTHIRWFETDDKWQFTNNGTDWSDLGTVVNDFYSNLHGTQNNIVLFGVDPALADSGVAIADLATAAQGTLANSATQPNDNISTLTNDEAFISDVTAEAVGTLSDVEIASPNIRHALMYDGVDSWDNRLLVEADISDLQTYSLSTHDHTGVYEPADAGIQTHIADATLHFTQASISITKTQVSDFVETDYATGAEGDLATSALQDIVTDVTPQLGGMLDVNAFGIGNGTLALLTFVEDASSVNNIQVENEATGSGPIISAVGTDTDVDINVNPKGAGLLKSGGVVVALTGADLAIFDNATTTNFTTDVTVATNHYTKTESDAITPAAGSKVDKIVGVSGNVVQFGASNDIADSGVDASDLATLTDPVFTGRPVMPTYSVAAVGSLAHLAGAVIYVSDATGSSLTGSLCFSNGTVWIDVTTGVAVV